MAERSAVNRMVVGSNPTVPAKFSFRTRVWYIGCASAFQAEEVGSTPTTRSNIFGD